MANGFDKWKAQLDDSSLDEVLPGFDTNAAWKELSPRLKKKEKNPFRLWAYAATLVGIFFGGLLLKTGLEKDSVTNNIVTVSIPAATTAPAIPQTTIITKTDTIIKTVVVSNPPKPQRGNVAKEKVNNEPVIVKQEPAQTNIEPFTKHENKTEQVIAKATPKRRIKAVHLLDINEEDRQIVIQDGGKSQSLQERIGYYLSSPGRITDVGNDKSPSGLKSLFKD